MKYGIALGLALLWAIPAAAGVTEGLSYFDNQQYPQAFDEFKPLADRGNEVAQYYIAYLYLNGYGVAKNEPMGAEYLQKSVDQGYEKAMSLMGYMLSEGIFFKQNKETAVQLYTKAAEAGDDDARLNLGVLYYLGDGVERDMDIALDYFKAVNNNEKPIVGRYIGDIYQFSSDETQQAEARIYYGISAAAGDLTSFHTLAYLDQSGFAGEKDLDRSLKYYTYAASQNYAPSQYALGILYAGGEGVDRSITSAYAWISLAANQGLPVAVEAQKKLEDGMTLSQLDQARRELVDIQRNIMGQVPPPLKREETMAAFSDEIKQDGPKVNRPSARRRRRR